MLVFQGESLGNKISFIEDINDSNPQLISKIILLLLNGSECSENNDIDDSNLQLIGSFDVFKVGDSHLRLVRLVGQLLHLLLDRVHPEGDHGGDHRHGDIYSDFANSDNR